jgi:hypothetical protein
VAPTLPLLTTAVAAMQPGSSFHWQQRHRLHVRVLLAGWMLQH